MCSCSLYRANRVSHPRERAPDKPSSPRPYGRWFRAGRKGVRTGPRTAACKQSPGGDRRGRVSKLRRRLLALWAVVASAVMLGMLSVPLPAAANPQFQVIATVDVGVNPFGDTIAPDGNTVWVANAGTPGGASGHTVTDLDARSTVTVIPTPDTRIFGVEATPDGRFVFATDFLLGEVSVISTATNQIIANVPVGSLPNDIAVTPDSSRAFVTNQGSTTVSVISISSV